MQLVVGMGMFRVGSGCSIPAWVGTISVVLSPGDHGGHGWGGSLGCPPSPLGSGHCSAQVPVPPRDSSALSAQVAAVREVLGLGQQPAALGCQSRRSQGGDGGSGQQSGDLQGTWGSRGDHCLLGWGDLSILGTMEIPQPLLLPRYLPSSYPIAWDRSSSGWSPRPKAAWWQWVMLASQAGHPQCLRPRPPYPAGAGEHPLPRGPVPPGAGELSTGCTRCWHRDLREAPVSAEPTRATQPRHRVTPPPSLVSMTHPAGHVGWEERPCKGARCCQRLHRGLRDSAVKPTGNFVWL